MASRLGLAFALAAVLGAVASGAYAAEPTAQEKETARAMMDEGHARRNAGDHQSALAQFQGANAIMHVPTTGLEVAREQAALGLLVEARDTLQAVLRTPVTSDEPEVFRAARANAATFDEALEKRIPALRISVTGAATGGPLQVSVDAIQVAVPALAGPFKVNPGRHVVSAAAAGAEAHEEVEVVDGQIASVTLTLSAPSEPQRVDVAEAPVESPSPREGKSNQRAWAVAVGGAGVALVGVGAFFGVRTLSDKATVEDNCNTSLSRCTPTGENAKASRSTAEAVSTIATLGGVAAMGVGAYLWLSGGPHPSTRGALSLRMAPDFAVRGLRMEILW